MDLFREFLKTWSLRSNSVTRQVSFNRTNIGGKCQNQEIQMRHFGWFSNTVILCNTSKAVAECQIKDWSFFEQKFRKSKLCQMIDGTVPFMPIITLLQFLYVFCPQEECFAYISLKQQPWDDMRINSREIMSINNWVCSPIFRSKKIICLQWDWSSNTASISLNWKKWERPSGSQMHLMSKEEAPYIHVCI